MDVHAISQNAVVWLTAFGLKAAQLNAGVDLVREAFGEVGYPVPEQRMAMRNVAAG